MAKYEVTLEDGRKVHVHSGDPNLVKKQANHHETSRVVIATKRGHEVTTPVSMAVDVKKIKD